MRNARAELRSDILIKGSPRYGPSGDTEFLDAVAPRVVIAMASNFPDSEKISARFRKSQRAGNSPVRPGSLRLGERPDFPGSLGNFRFR